MPIYIAYVIIKWNKSVQHICVSNSYALLQLQLGREGAPNLASTGHEKTIKMKLLIWQNEMGGAKGMDSLKEEWPQHFNSRNFYENAPFPGLSLALAFFLLILFFFSPAEPRPLDGTAAAENKNKGLIRSRGFGGNGAGRVRGQMHENLTSPWHLTCHLSYSSELENFSFSRTLNWSWGFPPLLRLTANSDNILKSLSGREECIFIE